MCGIFGIHSVEYDGITADLVEALWNANVKRGSKGYGFYASCFDGEEVTFRSRKNPELAKIQYIPNQLLLVHLRAPTSGSGNVVDGQPVISHRFVFGHNGILIKYPRHTLYQNQCPTDSGGWFHSILGSAPDERTEVENAILASTITDIQGQFACFFYDRKLSDLYLWRSVAPLFVHQTPQRLVFSSVPLEGEGWWRLEAGKIYRVPYGSTNLVAVHQFRTESIYEGVE